MATFSLDDARAVCKEQDAWWTVFLVDPLAVRLTLLIANRTSIRPDALTVAAFLLGLGSALCFVIAEPWALLAGAALYHVSFVFDCVDGKIARLKGTGTFFGAWLDYVLDRLRVLACGICLVTGQLLGTGDERYLFLGFVILFMDMFRYVNSLHVWKTHMTMDTALEAQPAQPAQPGMPRTDSGRNLIRERYRVYGALCEQLVRRRIRIHLFSGVEFQMFVFIIAPVAAAVAGPWAMVPIIAGAGLLLGLFELMVIYRLKVATSYAQRILDGNAGPRPAAAVPPPRKTTVSEH